MKLCPFCGRAIDDDARYCSGCGKKINEHDEITHNPITEAKDMDKGNGGRDLELDDVIALIANSIA